jgi:molecular chaperone HtpG
MNRLLRKRPYAHIYAVQIIQGIDMTVDTEEKLSFQAEVSRLLDIVAHSLYSEKEIFLRELISNASDASDKLRYLSLTDASLAEGGTDFKITITADKAARTLTIADNGIGMNRAELIDNLGTIARSGTSAFAQALADKKDATLIGQFGVGFYSAYMVADRVTVISRKAGESEAWKWESDGRGEFTVSPTTKETRGVEITLHLREGEDEYLEPARLKQIVRKYSDHIAIPIELTGEDEKLNAASALWMRPKSEITDEQYKEFYHHTSRAFDAPWLTMHWKAEGVIDYSALLFIPDSKPFNLFDPQRAHEVKLYVRRVFISEAAQGLIPAWLRFVRGIVDSEDLPLNISREMLQVSPVIAKIRQGVTKRVLSELAKRASDEADYAKFWENFGAVLKEGLYEDVEYRDDLLKLVRFRSTAVDGYTSLESYVSRMKEGQEAIYTIAGDNADKLRQSPQLEGFRARGVEVLLLTDPVDEFWPATVGAYLDHDFKSVTRGGDDLEKIKTNDAEAAPEAKPSAGVDALIALMKETLAGEVKDVRASTRLTDSAVCLVANEGDVDMHLERLLKAHKQFDQLVKRVLEINPKHRLIAALAGKVEAAPDEVKDLSWLLLDQARIAEGEAVLDAPAFARRLSDLAVRGLSV